MWHGAETRTSAESTRSGTRPSTRYAAFASSPCARHDIVHSSAHPSGASASSATRNACHRSSRPGQSTRASSASRSASNVAPRAGVTARATPTRRRSDAHSASRASAASAMTSEHRRPGGVDFSSERNPRAGRGSKLSAAVTIFAVPRASRGPSLARTARVSCRAHARRLRRPARPPARSLAPRGRHAHAARAHRSRATHALRWGPRARPHVSIASRVAPGRVRHVGPGRAPPEEAAQRCALGSARVRAIPTPRPARGVPRAAIARPAPRLSRARSGQPPPHPTHPPPHARLASRLTPVAPSPPRRAARPELSP
jgi:hypothetical protein